MIGKRIKLLRKANNLTQQDFAAKINISRSNIASIEVGRINVTERVLADICNSFDVNEVWLRTGEGSMQRIKGEDDALNEWVSEMSDKGCKQEFAKRFVNMLMQLDEDEWEVLRKMALKLSGEQKKPSR